jgi:16S rRNA (guanine966-N2)-methyltransferase
MSAEAVKLIIENGLLKEKALIISERSEAEEVEEFTELNIIKNKKYGNSLITIYQLK